MNQDANQGNFDRQKQGDASEMSLSLRSGTGAPIFEAGPTTRIRRNPVRAIAVATWSGGPHKIFGQVVNISLTGCLFRTETTIEPGTELGLLVRVVGGGATEEFEVTGQVRRKTLSGGRKAYGVEFCPASPAEKQSVQGLYSSTAR